MIETVEGVNNVEQIAAVPGIDALFIGCADLTMEYVLFSFEMIVETNNRDERLGIPGQYDSDLFHDIVARIADAAVHASTDERKVFIGLGGLETRQDVLKALIKKHSSIRYVSYSVG